MLYGLSRNLCQNSAKIVWTVRKYTQKCITAVTSISVPTNVIRQPWNACQSSQKLQLLFLFNFCAHHMLYDLHKSVWYGLFFLAVWNPYFSLLWYAFSPSANAVSFLSSTSLLLSLVLSTRMLELLLFSQQECFNFLVLGISPRTLALSTRLLLHHLPLALGISPRASWPLTKISSTPFLLQEWVRPLALINFMREGEEFSNLTAEIRLDGWLRFGVSSLTLTLIIKLSFNLHLTN